jgi:hypothetical protein
MGFVFPINVYIMENLYKYEICVYEMFLTCVFDVFDLLSLNVKLHCCKKKNCFINYSHWCMTQIPDWFFFENYYKFVDTNGMSFQDLILPFKNFSKKYDCLNSLSIKFF